MHTRKQKHPHAFRQLISLPSNYIVRPTRPKTAMGLCEEDTIFFDAAIVKESRIIIHKRVEIDMHAFMKCNDIVCANIGS
jgi:hypothetical protein